MRRRQNLHPPALAALLASAGCFTDNAPNIVPDATTSAGSSSTDPGTTGTTAGETTDESTTGSGDPLVDTGGESGSSSSTGEPAATTVVRPDTAGEPIDPYDQCLAQTADLECNDCLCKECLAEYTACDADPGCVAIEACAAENGCSGAACLEPCGDVIDMHGGLGGESVQRAIALSDCFTNLCCGP